jgi:NO-binding membrane sensor protein with MHYT domain
MTRSANRITGLLFGAGFIALAILSLVPGPVLGLFSISLALAAVYLAAGLALVVGALTPARRYTTTVVGTLLLALGISSLFLIGSEANVLDVTATTNLIHFASAAVLVTVGLGADREHADR